MIAVFSFFLLISLCSNIQACELMLLRAKNKQELSPSLINSFMHNLRSHSSANPNGWGIVAYKDGVVIPGRVYTYTDLGQLISDEPDSNRFASNFQASKDTAFVYTTNYLKAVKPDIIVAHIRRASSGSSTIIDPHPFIYLTDSKVIAFAHNGNVPSALQTVMRNTVREYLYSNPLNYDAQLDHLIADDAIDSSVYFAFLVMHLKLANWDMIQGLRDFFASQAISDENQWKFNFELSDGTSSYTYFKSTSESASLYYNFFNNEAYNNAYTAVVSNPSGFPQYDSFKPLDQNSLLYIPASGREVPFWDLDQTEFLCGKQQNQTGTYCAYEGFPFNMNNRTDWQEAQDFAYNSSLVNYESVTGYNYFLDVSVDPGYPPTYFLPYSGYSIQTRTNSSSYDIFDLALLRPKALKLITETGMTITSAHENWISYWKLKSASVQSAFGTNFHRIKRVWAQDWMYDCDSTMINGKYKRAFMNANRSLEFGKSYIVEMKEGSGYIVDFSWSDSNDEGVTYRYPVGSHNNYYSHGDRIQIEVDTVFTNTPINEICYDWLSTNSFVPSHYPMQVMLFLDPIDNLNNIIHFYYYDSATNKKMVIDSVMVYNEDNGLFENKEFAPYTMQGKTIRIDARTAHAYNPTQASYVTVTKYPNPFLTNIKFKIKSNIMSYSDFTMSIYNIKGQLVYNAKSTTDREIKWNGKNKDGVSVADGIYLCKATAFDRVVVFKIAKIK